MTPTGLSTATVTRARQDVHTSGVPVVCQSCEARHRGMCGALEPDELTALARSTHKALHRAGTAIVGEGQEVHSYANVMNGVVKLSKVLEDGRQQLVGLQFAPDFVGRLFGEESAVTAEAASDVELCVVSRATLERMVAESPALGQRLMRQTLRELDEARDWMLTLGRKTALERVASFVYRIAVNRDPETVPEDGATFDLPLSRTEMADFLGLTIETVSRQLSKLRRIGIVQLHGTRGIEVFDLGALAELCG